MPSSISKLLTGKKKAAKQFRRGSKTFRHNKNLRQKISAKKQYSKDKRIGKRFTRVARGLVDKLRSSIIHANQLEEPCAICLMPLEEISNTTELVCKHIYHTDCLINSFRIGFNVRCAQCRQPIRSQIISDLLSNSPQDRLVVAKVVLMEAEVARDEVMEVGSVSRMAVTLRGLISQSRETAERAMERAEAARVAELRAERRAAWLMQRSVPIAVIEARDRATVEVRDALAASNTVARDAMNRWQRMADTRIAAMEAVRVAAVRVAEIAEAAARVEVETQAEAEAA
jgi:hypothetical protein